jgi:hypothetical protein
MAECGPSRWCANAARIIAYSRKGATNPVKRGPRVGATAVKPTTKAVAIIILAGISKAGKERTTGNDAMCLGIRHKTRRMTRTTMK